MRLLLLFTLCFSLFIGGTVFAETEESTTPAMVVASPAQEEKEPVSEEQESSAASYAQRLYEQATDFQIKEAQAFFKRCRKNVTMSQRQDCKCAATAYIEKRIELGDDATPREIMNANKNICIKKANYAEGSNGAIDMSYVTDKQLQEADDFFKECQNNFHINLEHNCDCLAANFLQERIKLGPIPNKSIIQANISNTCRAVVKKTGARYTSCMSIEIQNITAQVTQKEYCECYARKWAESFENYKGALSAPIKGMLQTQASMYCEDQSAYDLQ